MKYHKLRDQLRRLTDLALKEAMLIHTAQGLLTAIRDMHQLDTYHLDIKPANMVIGPQGTACSIDFGCSVIKENGIISVMESNGDTNYLSPERLNSYRLAEQALAQNQDLDKVPPFDGDQTDAWALGVTLLELVTGAYPFDKASLQQKLQNWKPEYFEERLSQIAALQNPAPNSLMAVIKGLLAVDPKKRLSVEAALTMPVFQRKELFKTYGGVQQALTVLKYLARPHTEESVSQEGEDDKRNYLKTPQLKAETSEEEHSESEEDDKKNYVKTPHLKDVSEEKHPQHESEKKTQSVKQVRTAKENEYNILPNSMQRHSLFGSNTSKKPTANELQQEDAEENKQSSYQVLPR